jgi:hypothetical protein
MDDHPDSGSPAADSPVTDPSHEMATAAVARAYFYLFFIFSGVIAYLNDSVLTGSFVGVLVVGAFAVPLLLAAPLIYLKKALAAKGRLSPLNPQGKIYYRLIDAAGGIILWFATWGAINVVSG